MPAPSPARALIAFAALLAVPAIAAPARPVPARPAPGHAPGDVTRAQMAAQVRRTFDRADTDHDGYMSRKEFAAGMATVLNRTPPGTPGAPTKAQAQEMLAAADAAFNAVDVDKDGRLSRAEAAKRPLAAFDMMDANHDGILTVAEKIAARRPGAGAMPGTPGLPPRKLEPGR